MSGPINAITRKTVELIKQKQGFTTDAQVLEYVHKVSGIDSIVIHEGAIMQPHLIPGMAEPTRPEAREMQCQFCKARIYVTPDTNEHSVIHCVWCTGEAAKEVQRRARELGLQP